MPTGSSGVSRVDDRALLERLARRIGLSDRDLAILARVPLFAGLESGRLAESACRGLDPAL